jgi:hypothetical protein
MSLHALANHMQAKGRNNDSMLVHMTPGEVGGLQELAMAHGGSLTINPETGLPEAGFLSKLLPMIAGFALAPLTAGTSLAFLGATPLASALTVGAATGLATGSLEKGLSAGLGAYGGAGLGAGLTASAPAATGVTGATNAISTNGTTLAKNLANGTTGVNTQIANVGNTGKAAFDGKSLFNLQQAGGNPMGVPTTQIANATTPSAFSTIGQGAKASFGNGMEGLKSLYGNLPDGTLPALGAYALMSGDKKGIKPADNTGMIRPYTLNRQQNPDAYNSQISSSGQRMPVNAYGEAMDSSERNFFTDTFTPGKPYKAPGPEYAADGGIMRLAVGGQPEQQAAFQAVGMNANYPMSQLQTPMYSDPSMQRPMAREVVNPSGDVGVDSFTGEARMAGGGMTAFGSGGAAKPEEAGPSYSYKYNPQNMEYTETKTNPVPAQMGGKDSPIRRAMGQAAMNGRPSSGANGFVNPALLYGLLGGQQPQPETETRTFGGMVPSYMPPQQSPQSDIAQYAVGGGIADLGGYSDGGRLLRGPGDGVSDSIPASIGNRQPARLADGEFVVPARIVSEIGNGSTEAGARKLYAMMDRVQNARRKTVGKKQVAKNTKAEKLLPA